MSWRRARKADMVDVAERGERELEIRVERVLALGVGVSRVFVWQELSKQTTASRIYHKLISADMRF